MSACILVTIILPLILFVSLAIKIESKGPVLDRQTRISSSGRRFRMLKFGTTVRDRKLRAAPWAQTPTTVGPFLQQTRICRSLSTCSAARLGLETYCCLSKHRAYL
ncbi:MAG: sugar transferase [Deltaproteobacteria bacterium]|nr:sugar transferase [Deltaproteobacteria bacterium]